MNQARISLIIPTFNEENTIVACLQPLLASSYPHEILVADGGSTDRTLKVLSEFAELQLISANKGRAVQMNKAVEFARGEVFWFLHADSIPSEQAFEAISEQLQDSRVVGGAFRFALSEEKYWARLLEWGVALRNRVFGIAYGDQGIFIRREAFRQLGGFAELPILEDLYLWRDMRKLGKVRIVNHALFTSARRWQKNGVLKTTFAHWTIIVLDCFGVSPKFLQRLRKDFASGSD